MSITLRKRGEVWHARGTVRIGTHVINVREFSTGCHSRADAGAVADDRAARIRGEYLDGPAGRQKQLTINDALEAYLARPGGVADYDAQRVRDISDHIGDRSLADALDAWHAWLRMRAGAMRPGTVNRWRAIYVSALAAGCNALNAGVPPAIPSLRDKTDERVIYLADAERARLLASYTRQAGDVAVALAYQGFRTQEALRLDWRNVDLDRRTIHVLHAGLRDGRTRTKSGRGRTVPMHARVYDMLVAMLRRQKRVDGAGEVVKPDVGPVFISRRGKPYRDTQGKGGNPLSKAHASACRKAGITDFRVHDWRHDWAAANVMAGVDLLTLMRLGGWSSLRMVEKYGTVTSDHMRAAVALRA